MRRILIYIASVLCAAACSAEGPAIQTGDLLFQVGAESAMSGAIAAATIRDSTLTFTHVAIALTDPAGCPERDSVLEAFDGGVRITTLKEFLDRSARIDGRPAVIAMRLRDTTGITASVTRARHFVGLPYDYSYRSNNAKMYCSELVWESYRDTLGRRIFPTRPMNFRAPDGTMPAFWVELFEKLGEAIPEGVPGTNPNDMARDPHFVEVGSWF